MAGTIDQQIALGAVDDPQALPLVGKLHEWVVTVDHKRLGLMYIMGGLFFFLVAGLQAATIRLQLAVPDAGIVPPQVFNRLMTMHGTAMVFLVGMPILTGFFNYLVPLMIGARDLAFPRLNAFGFWLWFFGAILLYFSYIGGDGLYGAGSAPDVGWFAYAPLTELPFSRGNSTDYWILSIFLTSVGSTATAINIITSAFCMRCEGMTLNKMPVLVWLAVVVAFMMLVALPPLSAAQAMLLLDRFLGAHFFDTQAGGSAILWQHFFWIFGHPEVYILVIPAFAFASEIIPVFSRKVIFGYSVMVAASCAIGFISLSVWAHHMFAVGMTPAGNSFFAAVDDAGGRADRHQDFQLARHNLGRKTSLSGADAVQPGISVSVSHRGPDRHHARRGALRLASHGYLLRGRSLSLRTSRRDHLHGFRRYLLLVPKGYWPNAQ